MPHLVIGTAGHIDHGKSSLVLALTGTDPDRLKEEKARGITIDLGFAHYTDGDTTISFVDVPGHERFVRNMLAGVGGIDAVLLVVAADESVMPQTREHLDICRLLAVPRGIVALTKIDAADGETQQLARMEIAELVAGTALATAPVLGVSARTGEGLEALRAALRTLARDVAPRRVTGATRLPIDRAFTVRGFGTVVTGTLVAGRLVEGQDLVVLPVGTPAKVRGLQVHNARQSSAEAGHRVAVNLGGVDLAMVPRGTTLSERGALEATRAFDATFTLLPGVRPLKHRARVRVHQGTADVLARVSLPLGLERDELAPGQDATIRVRAEAPLVVTRGDRFVVRAYSPVITIGGGVVLDPHAPRGGIRHARAPERLRRLQPGSGRGADDEAISLMVAEQGAAGLPLDRLVVRVGLTPAESRATVARLVAARRVDEVGGGLYDPSIRPRLSQAVQQLVRAFHTAQPLSEGVPREEVRDRLFARSPLALFERVLADLADTGTIVGRERLAAKGHAVALGGDEAQARSRLDDVLRSAGLTPPDVTELAARVGAPADVVARVAALMVRQKALVKLETHYFHPEVLDRLKQEVRALKGGPGGGKVDVATFKDRYGLTRKFAIPLLEYLDRERVTRRVGDARVIL